MTEADIEYKQYQEQERVIAYRLWEQACHNAGGVIYTYNPVKPCAKHHECVPDVIDWKPNRRYNRTQCVKLR